jgi:excinuclease UvrABC nuclease subunit
MGQLLLLPDARPLDERLGRRFFREAPRRPGVYLMKDAAGRVLYVGKAKNLKQRLNNYRVANPDRMPPRHLRMVREVSRIEFQFCANETAALTREAKLLRGLKPKFNRAGVWQGPPRFLLWRASHPLLEMTVAETPETGWRRFGPLGGGASHLHRSLARLLWLAAKPDRAFTEMPAGWARGADMVKSAVECGTDLVEIVGLLDAFFWESPAALLAWLEARVSGRTHAFERAAITAELETLQSFADKQTQAPTCRQQLALL